MLQSFFVNVKELYRTTPLIFSFFFGGEGGGVAECTVIYSQWIFAEVDRFRDSIKILTHIVFFEQVSFQRS